jgi:hypothetical protein
MVRNYYAVRRNLLLRFQDDSIDETLGLAVLLQVPGRRGVLSCAPQLMQACGSAWACAAVLGGLVGYRFRGCAGLSRERRKAGSS